jgi:beta-1,3-galactosyltransferase 1
LYIGVPSAASNRARRDVVRNTWLQSATPTAGVQVAFYICGPNPSIEAENQEFRDIVMIPCSEGYGEGILTKKVFAMMEHFANHLDRNFTVFMKADDDAFVNMPQLLTSVSQQSAEHFYIGLMYPRCEPVRDENNVFYEPKDIWPGDYPASACGAGYVLDRGLVERMVDANRMFSAATPADALQRG